MRDVALAIRFIGLQLEINVIIKLNLNANCLNLSEHLYLSEEAEAKWNIF